jgi:hypothetical protein
MPRFVRCVAYVVDDVFNGVCRFIDRVFAHPKAIPALNPR